jgi:hypothetical protein
MSNAILDGTNLDLSVFSYSAPKPNPTGGKVVNLYNKHFKESLTISAPLIGSWGAQEVKTLDGVGTGKHTMTLQFAKGQYTSPDADKFLEQMKQLEQKIKQDAMTYSKDWFGKEIKSMDVMDEKFTPMLKYPKLNKASEERDYSQPPQLTVKLPCWKDVWQTSVFDEDYNPLYIKGKTEPGVTPLDFLRNTGKAPIQIVCLIQCAGIWFVGSPAKVSITWNFKQVIVRKPKTSAISDDTCFLFVRDSDREALKAQPETEVHPEIEVQSNAVNSAIVDDSDDEGEEYKLPEPVAVPTPVVVAPPSEPVSDAGVDEPPKKKVAARKVKPKE